jgi:predicted alpha/beta-hydrolase family hydrolase
MIRELTLSVAGRGEISALHVSPEKPEVFLVLAHGAGTGMRHPFLEALTEAYASLGVATLRYQFPYMETGRGRPDPPQVLHATVRAAIALAGLLAEGLPIFAGGKSMGGRMTSQAQADRPLADVRGLVFVGFPLHPVGEPGTSRADHLMRIAEPMLFLQGTRDRLALPNLLEPVLARLGDRAHVEWLGDGDHDFKVPVRGGMTRAQTIDWIAERTLAWMKKAI